MGQEEEEGKEWKKKQKHEIHSIDSGDEYMELDNDGSDGCTPFSNANAMVLKPVSPGDLGEGLPYAPENWPNPGDIWKWKVGKRKSSSGFYQDRYLYLPDRLRNAGGSKHRPFPSKPPVREYIRKAFPNADIDAFFASFTWKIPWADKIDPHLIKEGSKSSGMHPIKFDAIEQPASESTPGVMKCKAGNEICSLQTEEGSYFPALMDCDICCSETGFCRECCCILCGKTIDREFGGYGFIRCEAKVDEDYICGHVAHVNCALRAYTAGTVGGIIGLDVEYYCRRCDNKTDLISHVKKLLHTCESLDSQDDIVKILNLGLCILRGSQKTSAKSLLNHIESVLTKLKSGVHNEEIWKMDDDLAAICKDFPVLSKDQEQKLQAVKDHPDKDLGILLPKESGRISGPPPDPSFVRTGGPSLGTSSKRKAVDREVIGARLSSKNAPPSKVARADDTSRGNSSPVIKVSSLASTPSTGPRVCPHQVAFAVVSSQPVASSASIATPESSSPAIPPAPRSCPSRSGASAGAPTWAGPTLGNPLVIREKLGRFVFPPEVTQINALGTEGVIDSFLKGLAQAYTASVCLLSRARHNSQLKQENESIQKEISIAQRKIIALEAAGRASEADLTAAHERATGFETALSVAHERAAKAEAELVKAHKKASLSEAELVQTRERAALRETVAEIDMKVARERASQAEERAILAEKGLANGVADAFIDGYEELRGKISAAFPDVDFSGFVPTEVPDDGSSDDDDDVEDEDDGEDDDEDDGDSHESD